MKNTINNFHMHLTRTSLCISGWNWEVLNFNQALVIRAVRKGHQGGGQLIFKKVLVPLVISFTVQDRSGILFCLSEVSDSKRSPKILKM